MITDRLGKDEFGYRWVILHDGDWSGEVIVRRVKYDIIHYEAKLPLSVMKECVGLWMRGEHIQRVEQQTGTEFLDENRPKGPFDG